MPEVLEKIGLRNLRELLSKNWMTHDAMWFYHAVQECGIEKANKMNLAALDSMGAFEIKRLTKALGYPDGEITEFDQLVSIINDAFKIVQADFMKFRFEPPEKNVIGWRWEDGQCFAFEGMSRIGCIEEYECGIMRRVEAWLKTLGVAYRMDPPIKKCLMLTDGQCASKFIFDLK